MNRLEREVLSEIEADYEFDEDRAIAIVALCREAFQQEVEDAKPDTNKEITVTLKDYTSPMLNPNNVHWKNYNNTSQYASNMPTTLTTSNNTKRQKFRLGLAVISFYPVDGGGWKAVCSECGSVGLLVDDINPLKAQRMMSEEHRMMMHAY